MTRRSRGLELAIAPWDESLLTEVEIWKSIKTKEDLRTDMNQLMSQFPLSHGSYYIHLAIQTGLSQSFNHAMLTPTSWLRECSLLGLEHCHVPRFLQSLPLCLAIFIPDLFLPHLREAIVDPQLKLHTFKHAAHLVKPIEHLKKVIKFSFMLD